MIEFQSPKKTASTPSSIGILGLKERFFGGNDRRVKAEHGDEFPERPGCAIKGMC
jgi:hypothetical protein